MKQKSISDYIQQFQLLIAVVLIGVVILATRNTQPKAEQQKQIINVDSLKLKADSLQLANDSLIIELGQMTESEQQARVRLEQIRYYVEITEKRPQNKVFFFGWVKRALE